MESALKRFTEQAAGELREEIAGAEGSEVFALGFCGEDQRIERLKVLARGSEDAVPAVRRFFDVSDDERQPSVFIHNHPSGFLVPSNADLSVSAAAAESGIGAYIVDNDVSRVYVTAEPVFPGKKEALDPDKLCAFLENGGPLARRLPVYEQRDAQLELVRLAVEAFNEDGVAAAEAGTGVGKSFAYLLPALEFALLNNERIVVSTATITLQQQLFEKDIPLVNESLGKKVKAVLMKGRGNYLCRRRLDEALAEPPLDEAEYEELRSITAWAEHTETGGRSELAFVPSEGLWSRVRSEGDACMGMRCPERERCFFLRLRRESSEARLLVVNHHLLFADLAARYEGAGYDGAVVLPPSTRLIIDEAHTIENAATSFFSREWSRTGINRALSRLYRKRRGRESGLLFRLLAAAPALPSASPDTGALPAKLLAAHAQVREWADKADTAALSLCGDDGTFRLTSEKHSAAQSILFPALSELKRALARLTGLVRDMLEDAENATDAVKTPPESPQKTGNADKGGESAVWEVKSVVRRLEAAGGVCGSFLDYRENPADVYWIEKQNGKDPWAVLHATPVDVAPLLRDALFDANKTVICLSATLTVADGSGVPSFAYWARRTGADLSRRPLLTGVFPSPFPYASRALLAVPADGPPPDASGYQDFVNAASAALLSASGGSALVLFTSYQSLRSAWNYCRPLLEQQGIVCLKQGDDDRSRLLAAFLADTTSALFATDSFWEGVDAPGDTLRLVILSKLPFRPPNEPVFQARRELVESGGRNSFAELSLPDAVMKFKQGFGRLMRRCSDHGAVAVLDSRILHKFYGRAFINSLPETRTSFKELDAVVRDLESFLFS